MVAVIALIDVIQARGAQIELTQNGQILVTNAERLTLDDKAAITTCKMALISELKTIKNLLNRVLPDTMSTEEVMAAQDGFGMWVLLQAAQSQDRAFEQETVSAALRIYNDNVISVDRERHRPSSTLKQP